MIMLPAMTGKKAGMTRLFESNGVSVPVTAIKMDVLQIIDHCTPVREGYSAVRAVSNQRREQEQTHCQSPEETRPSSQH